MWMYYGERGDPVWEIFAEYYPGVLVNLFGEPRRGCYLVDLGWVDAVL